MGKIISDDWAFSIEPYENHRLDDELDLLSTVELFGLLEKALDVSNPDLDNRAYDGKQSNKIITVLATRLEYARTEDIRKEVVEALNKIIDGIEMLNERFENHRHKKEPNYSEKPVW